MMAAPLRLLVLVLTVASACLGAAVAHQPGSGEGYTIAGRVKIDGKYYLVDAGYLNRSGYLAPYKGQRYHVLEFRRGVTPSSEKEKFNYLHSSVCNVIERSFGVWKIKWRILLKIPSFLISKQKMIVAATMRIHNFISEHAPPDMYFRRFDRDPNYVITIPSRYA